MSGDKPGVINTSALESQVKLASDGGGPLPPLDETLPLSKIKPNTDTWYFSIECPKCRRTSPIFRDYSDGKLGNPFTGRGAVVEHQKDLARAGSTVRVGWEASALERYIGVCPRRLL